VSSATDSTYAARDHARAQAVPVDRPRPPEGTAATDVVWAETVPGGNYTHRVLARGTSLRLADPLGDACAHLLLHVADRPWERLNVADTTKVQWNAYLGPGSLLLSDQGRVLASVTEDSSGRHDALCGTSTLARNTQRYGDGTPQSGSPAGRELLLLAAAKNGALTYTGSAGPGTAVTLRAEQPLTVLIANVPHPLDPRPGYHCGPLEVTAWRGRATGPQDPLWDATPEGRRAFLNTAEFCAARGI